MPSGIFHRFSRDTLPAVPWKNGGGLTSEVVSQPPGSDVAAFDWRVSIAHIARSGPFSAFVGVDRVITLLEGQGVRLMSAQGGIDHWLCEPLQPFAFSGDLPMKAELLGGDCHDFNVMTRRGACRADVMVCRESYELCGASAGVLMSVRGIWRVNHETLAPGDGLWWADSDVSWSISSDNTEAALLLVNISPAQS